MRFPFRINFPRTALSVAAFVAAALIAAMPVNSARAATSENTCAPFPAKGYLTTHTHARITAHVNKRFNGRRDKIVRRLEAQLSSLRAHQADGRTVRLRVGAVVRDVSGAGLARYIDLSETRLGIVRCLERATQPITLAAFETAAGGEHLSHSRSSGLGERVKLSTKALCRNQSLILTVKNVGGDWPKVSTLKVYAIAGGDVRMITSRPMRMKANQVATFQVSEQHLGGRQIGFFVAPSWYKRDFAFDLNATCPAGAAPTRTAENS